MARGHLAKLNRLSPDKAATLFAEHHIVHVRTKKNGEISAVKHAAFGWMKPQDYYALEKLHDFMPLLQEVIRGGYQAKAWLWSVNIDVAGFSLPFGGILPVVETLNLYNEMVRRPVDPAMLALRAYALIGPWGDIIQILDFIFLLEQAAGYIDEPPPVPTVPGQYPSQFGSWLGEIIGKALFPGQTIEGIGQAKKYVGGPIILPPVYPQ